MGGGGLAVVEDQAVEETEEEAQDGGCEGEQRKVAVLDSQQRLAHSSYFKSVLKVFSIIWQKPKVRTEKNIR